VVWKATQIMGDRAMKKPKVLLVLTLFLALFLAGCYGIERNGERIEADEVIGTIVFWLVLLGGAGIYLAISKSSEGQPHSERGTPSEIDNSLTPAAKFRTFLLGLVLLALGLLLGKWWLGL
jgi:hypothetical protein